MNLYDFLVSAYNQFLGFFPAPLQWLVTLFVLIGLIGALIALVRHSWLALIIVIVLLPFIIPVLRHFVMDIYNFFVYLTHSLKATTPSS
ncbi:MAG TPA: hypothetical protein VLF21_01210 [Candidatus Saccharimonadales bacterium]|nr:hypothetical protein [Candidatus Saccharimonadales bacterium]